MARMLFTCFTVKGNMTLRTTIVRSAMLNHQGFVSAPSSAL